MARPLVETYNEDWPAWFDAVRGYLDGFVKDEAVSIEHVGSTSIPGMVAKPIIDLIVIIDRADFPAVHRKLETAGYVHQGDLGIADREAFDLIAPDVKRRLPTHFLYVCPTESAELRRQIAFRDFMRTDEGYREKLSRLKTELVRENGNDRQAYMAGKAGLMTEIVGLIEKRGE